MYYTYVLRSKKDKMLYTGCTKNLRERFNKHNSGEVAITRERLPLELLYYEACQDKKDAYAREKYLKSGPGKRYLKNRLKRSLSVTGQAPSPVISSSSYAIPAKAGIQKDGHSGFTLIEILVVTAIMIFIAGFALVVSMDSYRSYNYQTDKYLLLGVLQKARSQAQANINQKPHGVHIDQNTKTYTIFQGSPFAGRAASDSNLDIVFSYNPAYALSGATDIIFSQLSATAAPTNVTLKDNIHPDYNLCINSEGQINEKPTCP